MKNKLKGMLITVAAVAALATGGAAIASATGGDDGDKPVQGAALDRARAAALDRVGGGRVTDTEAGDEEGAYEVEVTRGDGSEVDVHLDGDFKVIGVDDDAGDRDDADDDGSDRDDD